MTSHKITTVKIPREITITTKQQLVDALLMRQLAKDFLDRFDKKAREWVDEHGPVQHDGKQWGPEHFQREKKASYKLSELSNLLLDLQVPVPLVERTLESLRRRGVGEKKDYSRYVWRRIKE